MSDQPVFTRKVAPFHNVEAGVIVDDVANDWNGNLLMELDKINGWIANGAIELTVTSPSHYLPADLIAKIRSGRHGLGYIGGGGKEQHRFLCALAAWFLIFKCDGDRQKVGVGGASRCAYAAGWADVCLLDGSLFVECGTLRFDKLFRAMQAGQTLMIMPYERGARLTREAEDRLIVPDPRDAEEAGGAAFRDVESIQLAYTFKPIAVPKRDPFAKNAAKGMF